MAMSAGILTLLVSGFVVVPSAHTATGMRVRTGRLVEANGRNLVLRGINHVYRRCANQAGAFAAIKAAGANAIRPSLAIGAGFPHTLMVDAPDWGQELSFTMRDNAGVRAEATDPAAARRAHDDGDRAEGAGVTTRHPAWTFGSR
ncbi:hypothetical protein ACNTMW_13450 [Planosporangium sp. 12N6]|uniref:hypothetical protein n=1 Tax=Planosporangium spinosum TaxID=3402278 RepID=UPI003CF758EF